MRTAYWLSNEGEETTGPFTSDQLRSMWSLGQVTIRAIIMEEGDKKERWKSIEELVKKWPAPMAEYEERKGGFSLLTAIGITGLVGVVALLGLIWITGGGESVDGRAPTQSNLALNAEKTSVENSKAWLLGRAQDPRSLAYHSVTPKDLGPLKQVDIDFSQSDGRGGVSRHNWRFLFNKSGYSLLGVLEGENKVIYMPEAVRSGLDAAQAAAEKAIREGRSHF